MDDMVSLNIDRKETAFVLGDTPFHLAANGTDLHNWATNAFNAAETGDEGLITADEYLGIYYPSGFSTNLDGTNVVVPASHMTLRSLAYNDQVAYQWFAPAGLNRGVVSNASSVGYVNAEGEFAAVSLNQGLRDVLYTNNINPIRVIPNSGIVLWGQKTRASAESAMDRINVARLLNFIRYQADILSHGFLFEPNDDITRGNAKSAYDALLSSLVTLRGLYDFLVVCDKSNNTPDRIDRNELWIDIAIQPVKAIEFIYIPIRIKNTGSSLAG
jgi:phage tail sheath protein FI